MTKTDGPDWFLKEWAQVKGKKQADLVSELGWVKNAAFRIWHGNQPYRRDILNEVAGWLGVQPFELLMPPSEAMAYRRFRESAAAILGHTSSVTDASDQFLPQPKTPAPRRRTGTLG